MANRTFQEDVLGLVKRKVTLFAVVSVGGAGAVTLQKRTFSAMGATSAAPSTSLGAAPTTGVGYAYGDGGGIRSVARTGTGLWTVTLSDSYQYLLGVVIKQTANASGLITAAGVGVLSGGTNVTTNTATGNGGVISLALNDWAGAAVDPASGDTLTLELVLGDATEP